MYTRGMEISYEQFSQIDVRVCTILAAERVPDTDKLLKCTIDAGDLGERTVVSGIAAWKQPEDLIGKQCLYVVNLAPRVLRGVESQGMLFAGSDEQGVVLMHPERPVPPGTSLH
ncbi:MAG: methionyl-tRNA synthetase, beta subunit [Candidatus Kaiserbacteria bacterium]|nr:methionyl-tRNA synthetase, beta subunit [Candidatus Kaiserbacteria bacterium]